MYPEKQKPRKKRGQRRRDWRWYVLGLGVLLMGLVGCRTTQYTVVGSGGGVQLGPVDIELRSFGQRLPCFTHNGQFYVVGSRGMRYAIWIRNRTPQRLEVVVSVDGRDVITGRRRQPRHRGYILNPYRYVNITGYRTSLQSVAAFRFSSIHRSYSARKGSSWFRVGSIVVSVFSERGRRVYGRPLVQPRRYSGRPSILRKRGYAATPPNRSSRPRVVRKPRVYRRYRRKLAKRYQRRAPRRDNITRGPQFAPAPGIAKKSLRPAPPAPPPSTRYKAPSARGGSADDSYARPTMRRRRARRRMAPSHARPLGGIVRRESRQRQSRPRPPSHNYHHPAPPEGLGTSFGERRFAPARYTTFVRASHQPAYVLKIMYNNCAAYRYIGLCTPWCPCYRRPAPRPRYVQPHDPTVP